jgi:hypothetical protein
MGMLAPSRIRGCRDGSCTHPRPLCTSPSMLFRSWTPHPRHASQRTGSRRSSSSISLVYRAPFLPTHLPSFLFPSVSKLAPPFPRFVWLPRPNYAHELSRPGKTDDAIVVSLWVLTRTPRGLLCAEYLQMPWTRRLIRRKCRLGCNLERRAHGRIGFIRRYRLSTLGSWPSLRVWRSCWSRGILCLISLV